MLLRNNRARWDETAECLCLLQLINAGKGEALRIRAILRSLVPTTDLVGVISIPLIMPVVNKGMLVFSWPVSYSFLLYPDGDCLKAAVETEIQ